MCDFNAEEIKTAITSCNHYGKEFKLQCILARSLGLCLANCKAICKFSPSINEDDFNKYMNSAGLELGFKPQPVSVHPKVKDARRYIDLASVTWKTCKEPASINWLCEVKVIDPKRYTYKGRWYPYMFQYQCYPPMFDFRQPADSKFKNKFITDADEGQIIFDFIKMMACTQKIGLEARLYQILAIRNDKKYDFNYWKNKLIRLLEDWGEWCGVKVNATLQIYEWEDFVTKEHGKQEIALQCKLEGVTGCAITDLGSSNEYQHILIDWQTAQENEYNFKFGPAESDVKHSS